MSADMEDIRREAEKVFSRILRDIEVELKEEFDQNFEREAFFSQRWERRKSPVHGSRSGHLLVDTGTLRGSIQSRIEGDSVVFWSDLPNASIHNNGGDIVVTERMKRFFWAKYHESNGGKWGRRGEAPAHGSEAEFWKLMALKKVGSTVRIPRRRFLGVSPEVEKAVKDIVEEGLGEYFEKEFKINFEQ